MPVQVNLQNGTATGEGTDKLGGVENAYGSPFNDKLVGDVHPNTLSGFEGDDTISGGADNDRLFGAAGMDTLNGELGNDEIVGGSGIDMVTYANAPAAVTVDMTTYAATATGGAGNDMLSTLENVTGSPFADSITGSSATNILLGAGGNDALAALGGNDTLDGGADVDSVDGGADLDSCLGETRVNCEK
jgi:Ca2+-binding RTX toxin-like protein